MRIIKIKSPAYVKLLSKLSKTQSNVLDEDEKNTPVISVPSEDTYVTNSPVSVSRWAVSKSKTQKTHSRVSDPSLIVQTNIQTEVNVDRNAHHLPYVPSRVLYTGSYCVKLPTSCLHSFRLSSSRRSDVNQTNQIPSYGQ